MWYVVLFRLFEVVVIIDIFCEVILGFVEWLFGDGFCDENEVVLFFLLIVLIVSVFGV